MTLLIDKLKEISVFLYILIFLLVFNLFFNLNYSWYGVSLIVRIYLFVVSFYLIFGFASLKIKNLKGVYIDKYGQRGEMLLFLETRIFPLALIYFITILFTLIDYIRLPDWPWNPFFSLLNGRYSNTIIYSLLLFIFLKLRKEPRVTIPLFLGVSVLYFYIDKNLYHAAASGIEISAIKMIKLLIFFIILFYEFFSRRAITLVGSLVFSCIIFTGIVGNFLFFYNYPFGNDYVKKESGLQLVSFGFNHAFEGLQDAVIVNSDYKLFQRLVSTAGRYDLEFGYTGGEWKKLLFNGPDDTVDLVSKYIAARPVELSYDEIVSFVEKRSEQPAGNLERLESFISLSGKYVSGHEEDLIKRMKTANKSFKLWGIAVIKRGGNIEPIPLLVDFLTDIDINISGSAYLALKKITGLDPAKELNRKLNDPDVILVFKKYYLERRSSGTAQ